MCTLLILFRPKDKWPLIIAGNRDEMIDRPWLSPGKHWPDSPNIIAGKDLTAGGSWLGINEHGLVATILNRSNSLGPSSNKLSRGNIVIDVLNKNNIEDALSYIKSINNSKWKPFNLFLANNKRAYWIKSNGKDKIEIHNIPEGKHFLDSHDNLNAAIITPDAEIVENAIKLKPAYIIFNNYKLILKWNRSLRFSLAVCTLKNSFENET